MARHAVTAIFAAMAVAIGAETVGAIGDAVRHGALSDWLGAGYNLLKLTVALAFTAFVVTRAPARSRTRDPIAYLACAGAIVPVALQAPTDTAAPGLVLAGELVAVLGCGWMLVAALALGRCFGVLPEARGLVTTGPYRLVRHPLYLGEFAAMGGLLIASPTTRNLAAGSAFAAAQATRMWLEERALENEFPEYRAYAARTPRILPFGRRPALLDRVPAGETGATLAEYAPILGIIAVMVAVVLTPLGAAVSSLLTPVVQAF